LVAYGITIFGIRELISFRQVGIESKAKWTAFLEDLHSRGLKGRNLRLITVDGNKGLLAAVEEVYPFIPLQRCWAHKMRNVVSYLSKKYQKQCSSEDRLIYNAPHRLEATRQFKT